MSSTELAYGAVPQGKGRMQTYWGDAVYGNEIRDAVAMWCAVVGRPAEAQAHHEQRTAISCVFATAKATHRQQACVWMRLPGGSTERCAYEATAAVLSVCVCCYQACAAAREALENMRAKRGSGYQPPTLLRAPYGMSGTDTSSPYALPRTVPTPPLRCSVLTSTVPVYCTSCTLPCIDIDSSYALSGTAKGYAATHPLRNVRY
eukprot:1545664-Rhodomonas_salina.4